MSEDALLPSMGPIDTARFALDLVEARCGGDRSVRHRMDSEDPELVAVIDALVTLAAVLVQSAAHAMDGQGNVSGFTEGLLNVIRAHQETRHDLSALWDGGEP